MFTFLRAESLLQNGAMVAGVAVLFAVLSSRGVPRFVKGLAAVVAVCASVYLIFKS